MDKNVFNHSFSQHVQTPNMINILHLLCISIIFLCCYPYSLTQKSPSQKKRQYISFGISFFLYCCSFITGWIIQLTTTTTATSSTFVTIFYLALSTLLFVLFCVQSIIEYNKHGLTFLSHHQDTTIYKLFSSLSDFITGQYEIITLGLEWSILTLGYFYWISSLFVYTFTFDSFSQWYLPIATGTGLLLYGSLALLHLLNIIKLPRQSPSPEFYEAIFMLLWGFISFIWWDTPIILSSWKAVNLGLLWTTGGILSLAMTLQPWIPYLQKRNFVNGLIVCWTGKSILTSYAADDNYEIELQTTLGYILMTGGFARLLQVLFRKSALDNLPKLYSRASSTFNTNCDDDDNDMNDDDTTCVDDLDIGQRRVNDFETTYRQLTGTHHDHHNNHNHSTSTSCKHQSVFASITIVCGLLSCFMVTASGVLFIGTTSSFVEIIRNSIEDPSTYINVILAISFLWITYVMILSSLYLSSIKSNHYNYSNLATSDLPISMSQPYLPQKYFDPNKMTTPTSSSTLYDPSQQHFTSVPLVPLSSSPSSSSPIMASSPKNNNAAPSSPPMRPSQYRAKRRSLLISTAMQNNNSSLPSPYYNNNDRMRKAVSLSSVTGVGGILPDEIQNYDYTTSPVNLNHHQRFSGSSSTTLFSPPRPKSTSTMVTSLSSSTTTTSTSISSLHRHSWQQQQQEYTDSHSSSNETNSLHKTESGKRKERQMKKSKRRRARCTNMDINTKNNNHNHNNNSQDEQDGLTDDDTIDTSSGSEERARYNHNNYNYTSENNNSNNNIGSISIDSISSCSGSNDGRL